VGSLKIATVAPFSARPSGVRPPVCLTAARANGMISSIDLGGFKYDGKRGAGYFSPSCAPETHNDPLKRNIANRTDLVRISVSSLLAAFVLSQPKIKKLPSYRPALAPLGEG
jgi:hypothetical protein